MQKTKLNFGLEYVNSVRKMKKGKEMGPPCKCRLKCADNVNKENRKILFNEY